MGIDKVEYERRYGKPAARKKRRKPRPTKESRRFVSTLKGGGYVLSNKTYIDGLTNEQKSRFARRYGYKKKTLNWGRVPKKLADRAREFAVREHARKNAVRISKKTGQGVSSIRRGRLSKESRQAAELGLGNKHMWNKGVSYTTVKIGDDIRSDLEAFYSANRKALYRKTVWCNYRFSFIFEEGIYSMGRWSHTFKVKNKRQFLIDVLMGLANATDKFIRSASKGKGPSGLQGAILIQKPLRMDKDLFVVPEQDIEALVADIDEIVIYVK